MSLVNQQKNVADEVSHRYPCAIRIPVADGMPDYRMICDIGAPALDPVSEPDRSTKRCFDHVPKLCVEGIS